RGDALAADLAPREALPLDEGDRPAGARQEDGRARPGRPGADDDDIETRAHRSAPFREAQKQCVKSPSSYSSSSHALAAPGQAPLSSRPTKPARTLSTASSRVTALAPRKATRWLATSAKRLRLGSQATSASARRSQPPSRRANALPSK